MFWSRPFCSNFNFTYVPQIVRLYHTKKLNHMWKSCANFMEADTISSEKLDFLHHKTASKLFIITVPLVYSSFLDSHLVCPTSSFSQAFLTTHTWSFDSEYLKQFFCNLLSNIKWDNLQSFSKSYEQIVHLKTTSPFPQYLGQYENHMRKLTGGRKCKYISKL